jgi:Asp/Glu/hydantoin racemase
LRKVVDVKILTKKTVNSCRQYHLTQVYNVNKYLMSEHDIKDLKNCEYIADCNVPGVVESIIKTFTVLGYRVGIVTNHHDEIGYGCVIITTNNASPQLLQNSWVRINSAECEKGIY